MRLSCMFGLLLLGNLALASPPDTVYCNTAHIAEAYLNHPDSFSLPSQLKTQLAPLCGSRAAAMHLLEYYQFNNQFLLSLRDLHQSQQADPAISADSLRAFSLSCQKRAQADEIMAKETEQLAITMASHLLKPYVRQVLAPYLKGETLVLEGEWNEHWKKDYTKIAARNLKSVNADTVYCELYTIMDSCRQFPARYHMPAAYTALTRQMDSSREVALATMRFEQVESQKIMEMYLNCKKTNCSELKEIEAIADAAAQRAMLGAEQAEKEAIELENKYKKFSESYISTLFTNAYPGKVLIFNTKPRQSSAFKPVDYTAEILKLLRETP